VTSLEDQPLEPPVGHLLRDRGRRLDEAATVDLQLDNPPLGLRDGESERAEAEIADELGGDGREHETEGSADGTDLRDPRRPRRRIAAMTESNGGASGHDDRATPTPSLTRGFLFADLRGYTSFIDRRGVTAAADLLNRFRHLVREAVSVHHGAEIRTEGDSFYVVFPSSSMAVACALDIVRAAGDEGVHREDAIHVGVGVHAGESLDTPEGPVGTAVNIAARLCAMAGPGEVIVSDTVRALTRSVGTAAFVSLGRRRIKGLDEAVSVYRAVPAGTAIPRRRRKPRPTVIAVAAAAAVGALALSLAVLVLARQPPTPNSPGSSAPASRATTAPAPSAAATAPAGSYSSLRFALPFRILLGPDWSLVGDRTDIVAFGHYAENPVGWIDIMLVAATLDPPCAETTPAFVGGRPQDVIDWLSTRPWVEHGPARPYNIGPYQGRAIDIRVIRPKKWTCSNLKSAFAFRLGDPTGGSGWGAAYEIDVGERKRVVAVDVDGRTVTFVMGSPAPDVEEFWSLAAPLTQSIHFTGKNP
jgi:class 3 adenylate cyclase